MDETVSFNQTGNISKIYSFYTVSIVKYMNEYIDLKEAKITNIQINNVKLAIGLGKQNTANVLNNVEVSLNVPLQGETKFFKVGSIPINSAVEFLVNDYLDKKGVQELRKFLEENIVGKNNAYFNLFIKASVPSRQRFTGDISIKIDVTMDAVTCEEVFLGFDGDGC